MAYSLTTVNLVSAFLILVLGFIIGTSLANIVKKIIKSIELNKAVEKHFNLRLRLEHTLSAAVKYFFFAIALSTALTRIGIPLKYLYWLITFIIVATIVFIGLSLKDLIPNLLAWFSLRKTQHIKIGETLKLQGVEGKVINITLLETQLETHHKEIISVPNSLLLKELEKK